MKTYQEPNVEFISLVPQDVITDNVDGDMELVSNIFPF